VSRAFLVVVVGLLAVLPWAGTSQAALSCGLPETQTTWIDFADSSVSFWRERFARPGVVVATGGPQLAAEARAAGAATLGVYRHALRNALIAPFTVIMLQFAWLLNGVVIVETLFNYKGFGWTLVQAAGNNDIELLLGCSVVAVFVVLITQLISDIGYVFLNPRIRLA